MILAAPVEPQGGLNVAARVRGAYFIPSLVSDAGKSVKENFAGISSKGSNGDVTGSSGKRIVAGIPGVASNGVNASTTINAGIDGVAGKEGNARKSGKRSNGGNRNTVRNDLKGFSGLFETNFVLRWGEKGRV